jgi:hypothetical protein
MGIESNQSTDEFDNFVASGEVEIGATNAGDKKPEEEEKPAAKRGPPRTPKTETAKAPAGDEDTGTEGDEGDEGEDEGDEGDEKKPKKSASEHQIERLKREKRDLQRQIRQSANSGMEQRLEQIERRLTTAKASDSQAPGKAPDPSDADKYPLGHLDDRYIEDKLEWLADQKATKQADSVLQRQQESERDAAAQAMRENLLEQVEDLNTKGSELYDDFQETVVDSGMRGDWDLSQPTFEAAAEADHGAQILYELSQDKKEARRVAKLSPYQQLKFVQERDAEIGSGKKPRTKPQAGEPPKNQARGANSKTQINPATDNLDDFEKAWERDAKKS